MAVLSVLKPPLWTASLLSNSDRILFAAFEGNRTLFSIGSLSSANGFSNHRTITRPISCECHPNSACSPSPFLCIKRPSIQVRGQSDSYMSVAGCPAISVNHESQMGLNRRSRHILLKTVLHPHSHAIALHPCCWPPVPYRSKTPVLM